MTVPQPQPLDDVPNDVLDAVVAASPLSEDEMAEHPAIPQIIAATYHAARAEVAALREVGQRLAAQLRAGTGATYTASTGAVLAAWDALPAAPAADPIETDAEAAVGEIEELRRQRDAARAEVATLRAVAEAQRYADALSFPSGEAESYFVAGYSRGYEHAALPARDAAC